MAFKEKVIDRKGANENDNHYLTRTSPNKEQIQIRKQYKLGTQPNPRTAQEHQP